MKVKCDYCQSLVDENERSCPNCGAVMPTVNRTAPDQPKTIEQLQEWYRARNLPPENVTRFFIGKDIKEAKAFGIYKNSNGDFVVYKNKADGSRAIRYQGVDEEYAVNEIYQKLKVEIANQKSRNASTSSYSAPRKSSKSSSPLSFIFVLLFALFKPIGIGIIAIVAGIFIALFDHSPSEGYYRYQGNDYYYQGNSWYAYDSDSDSWGYAYNSGILDDIINDDTDSDYRIYNHSGYDFEDTSWYDDDDDYSYSSSSSYSYSWDSGSSWDSDSSWDWDSGSSWNSGGSWNSNW
ncbi:MAG: hypothetical protein J6X94_08370 [Lachnospiraceae bacterium]|nr:hypothetical protein [Lachnospiraceae bacterium]